MPVLDPWRRPDHVAGADLTLVAAFLLNPPRPRRDDQCLAEGMRMPRAPAYLASHPAPASPRELLEHRCINFRHRGESVYKWELDKGDESVAIAVTGSLVLDDEDLVLQAAIDDAGLGLVAEERAAAHIARGQLIRVMEDWTPPFPGYFLYYPHRKQQPAALTAVIETFRLSS